MRTIIECVPNVSEGRDRAAIDAMAAAVRSASPECGCSTSRRTDLTTAAF